MELDGDSEVPHYDFSTASDLEIFIARLEEIIYDWHLPVISTQEHVIGPSNFRNIKCWSSKSEKIQFADVEFELINYCFNDEEDRQEDSTEPQLFSDLLKRENDFCKILLPPNPGPHPLVRWYGLRNILVLTAQNYRHVATESKIKILLSCLNIAASNSNCSVPLFLQAQEEWQQYFLGVCRSRDFRTDFEMVHLAKTPSHCKYLTGLISLFKSKIGNCSIREPLTVAARFTYILKEWACGSTSSSSDFILGTLPFGPVLDLIGEFHLRTIWPRLLDNSVVDGETYSDLEPMQAPLWKVTVFLPTNPACLLHEHLTEFLCLGKVNVTCQQFLGHAEKYQPIPASLTALTQSKVTQTLSNVLKRNSLETATVVNEDIRDDTPIQSDALMGLLYYLFPDADPNMGNPYPANFVENSIDGCLSGLKASPYQSLTWRLAIVMAQVVYSLGGINSAVYLWTEFVQELRYRVENSIFIPGLENGFISHRNCLLYQKLQLLNYCIERRIAREKVQNDSDESDDEFYDATDSIDEDRIKQGAWDKPIGRRSKHENLLLLVTGEPLYIPHTQEPVPKTEDQLEEHADLIIGADSESRTRILSESLLSDMESFKAANPGCVLADFIRWFSPRDWLEDGGYDKFGQKSGRISSRMEIPGNTWQEVWSVAKLIPARWQKRLFDDTKESENTLRFFETRSPLQFMMLLLPNLITVLLHRLFVESAAAKVSDVQEILLKLIKRAELLCRNSSSTLKNFENFALDLSNVEIRLAQADALRKKFLRTLDEPQASADTYNTLHKFLNELLVDDDVEVPGGSRSPIGTTICSYFKEAVKIDQLTPDASSQLTSDKWTIYSPFPPASEKEFIFRVNTSKGPQRLFASLKKNEFRLCGAFTSPELVIC